MIFLPNSDSELALSEFGCGLDFSLGMLVPFWFCRPILVCGCAAAIGNSHIHITCVFTGAAVVGSNATSPARAITGCGSISVLQRLVFHVRVGVGTESPDSLNGLVHGIGGLKMFLFPRQALLAGA